MGGYWAPRYFARRYFAGRYFAPPVSSGELLTTIAVSGQPLALTERLALGGADVQVIGGEFTATIREQAALEAASVHVIGGTFALVERLSLQPATVHLTGGGFALRERIGLAAALIHIIGQQVRPSGEIAGATVQVIGQQLRLRMTTHPPFTPRALVHIHDAVTLRRLATLTEIGDLNRSYGLRDHGRTASWTMGVTADGVEHIDPDDAHLVVIESVEYPLPWVGWVVEAEWDDEQQQVTVTADAYDAILGARDLPAAFATSTSVLRAVQEVMADVNARNETHIAIGRCDPVSAPALSLSNATALDALDQIARSAGLEWWLSYEVSAASVVPKVNMSKWRGADLAASVALTPPTLQVPRSRKDGRAKTYAQTVVAGQTSVLEGFTERERAVAVRDTQALVGRDQAAAQRIVDAQQVLAFGHVINGGGSFRAPTQRRERLVLIEALKEGGAGDVSEELLAKARAGRVMQCRVLPDREGQPADIWRFLEPGNVLAVSAPRAFGTGYSGVMRVFSVQPMEHERFVDLVVEVS